MSWIDATGQRWKLHVFFALMFLTFVCLFWLFVNLGRGGDLAWFLTAGALGLALLGYAWVALAVRCPNCHRRIGWLVLSAMGSSQWLLQLWRGEVCPSCGDPATH